MKQLPRITLVVAAAVGFSLLPTLQPAQAAGTWLNENFQDETTGVFDSSFGLKTTPAGHQGNGVRVDIPSGSHWGATAHWNTQSHLGSEPEEMWMRYWVKFPLGFRVDSPYRGKLPGFGGLYTYNCLGGRPSTVAAPCWSARMAFSPMYAGDGLPTYSYNESEVTRISFYAYLLNSGGTGQTGKIFNWDPDVSTLEHGRWYCVEGRIKMNALGQQNGVLEGYVDGKNAFKASNLIFRRASEPQLKVKSLWFDVYYGGVGTSPKDNEIFFDSVAAGPDRIGCNDLRGSSGTFYDDDGSVFENAIEKLAASGITQGCNPPANDRFCPEDSVTRGQMAAFLRRGLGDQYPVTLIEPPGSPPPLWGGRSDIDYKTALSVYSAGGAPFDTYVVSYPIDEVGGDKDWLHPGSAGDPNQWVPLQLGRIWDAGATPYVMITVKDLKALAAGTLNQRLDRMLTSFAAFTGLGGGRRIIIDVLPDANDKYNSYGDDPTRFKAAFRAVADRARSKVGKAKVRIAFSALRVMKSDKYSPTTWGFGGFKLYWPGRSYVDLAGVSGYPSSAPSNVRFYESAIREMSDVAGPGEPIIITSGGAPSNPSQSAQIAYAQGLANLANTNRQVLGVQWDDITKGGLDLKVSTSTSLQSGFAAAVSSAHAGGVDWIFSTAAKDWSQQSLEAIPFDDSTSSVFVNAIAWLSASGITQGCGPRRYCPDDLVTRGQMAAFLSRALKLPNPLQPFEFSDSVGHLFESAISKLAHAGITLGCNPPSNDRFCPDDYVTRGQMAGFLVRAGLAG